MATATKKTASSKTAAKKTQAIKKTAAVKKAPAKKVAPKKAQAPTRQKVNRVSFLLDASVSMSGIASAVKKQFALLISGIRDSTPKDQAVEVSIFTFSRPGSLRTLCLNQDIGSINENSVISAYSATGGSTALVQSTLEAIASLQSAFEDFSKDTTNLLYVITDGEDNSSNGQSHDRIRRDLASLGDRWSVAVLVPSVNSRISAERFGFPHGNIEVWNATSAQGVEIATKSISGSYQNYTQARSLGATSSNNLFHVDASNLTNKDVRDNLTEFNGWIFPVRADSRIDDFVSKATGKPYVKGSAYYELSKYEKKVQGYKKIAVRSKTTDKTYGGAEARKLLGLGHGDVAVSSAIVNGNWRVFVQSTSDNRKLIAGTSVLVER